MNINDVRDAVLLGETKYKRAKADFAKSFYAPIVDLLQAEAWRAMPAEVKDSLKTEKPSVFRDLNKRYGEPK